MLLRDFLVTASADHETAMAKAHAFTVTTPKLYSANVMTLMLVGAGVYGLFSDTALDTTHPVRDICLALTDRLRSEGEFNMSANDPAGQANLGMVDALIQGLPDYAPQLSALKKQLVAGAQHTQSPLINTSLYDVLTARNATPTVAVSPDDQRFILATSTADSPAHNPVIWGMNPRTKKTEQVGVLRAVSAAGIYEARIGHEHKEWVLTLDNPYGVFGV